jgi:hypothetical protein
MPWLKSALQWYTFIHITSIDSISLFHSCNKVWFDQTASWMLHGLLSDRFKEYFIVKNDLKDMTSLAHKWYLLNI